MEEIAKSYLALGVGGVLTIGALWLIRHLITVTIPDILRHAADQQRAERDQCQKNHESQIATMNAHHEAVIAELTDNRHAIQDLANEVRLRNAVGALLRDDEPTQRGNP